MVCIRLCCCCFGLASTYNSYKQQYFFFAFFFFCFSLNARTHTKLVDIFVHLFLLKVVFFPSYIYSAIVHCNTDCFRTVRTSLFSVCVYFFLHSLTSLNIFHCSYLFHFNFLLLLFHIPKLSMKSFLFFLPSSNLQFIL